MSKIMNNKVENTGKTIVTMNDLCAFIGHTDLPPTRKAELQSAIRKTNKLTGHGVMDQVANLRAILIALDRFSSAMSGLSPGGFANLKSRLRAAFKLARSEIVSVRNVELSTAWLTIRAALPRRHQIELSRFMRFCTFSGWAPEDIEDAHFARYRAFLEATIAVIDTDRVVRTTIRAWNRVARLFTEFDLSTVTLPTPERTSYWLSRETWPAALNADVDAFLDSLRAPTFLQKSETSRLKPATIEQYKLALITVVSSLVALGDPLASMTSLGQVVSPANVERVMHFLHERFAGRVTSGMATIAARCRRAAVWCKLPKAELDQFDDLLERVGREVEPQRGMTRKNQSLIDRLDDPQFRDLFLVLPLSLMQEAHRAKDFGTAASYARTAVAIELFMTCTMRRANLASLELGKNIKKTGLGKKAYWVIEFASEDVKNAQPLRYILPTESAQMLEDYLEHWRPYFCPQPNDWLFPSAAGGPPNARSLACDISSKSKQVLGARITPHQFRHLSASIYVDDNPNNLAVASEHLGHASLDTTRCYYLRSQQKAASRLYQTKLGLDRARAVERTTRNSRRRYVIRNPKQGDLL